MNKRITATEKIKALREARAQLASLPVSQQWGICGRLYNSNKADVYLRRYIERQLGGFIFLTGWIRHNRPHLPTSDKAMRRYRLQWIDWMIASLEGKEYQLKGNQ